MTSSQAIDTTKEWIQQFIIRYNICPFAARSVMNHEIYFFCSDHVDIESQLLDLVVVCNQLVSATSEEITNAFLIFYNCESSFEEFLVLEDAGSMLLEEKELDLDLQLVGFHPQFRYADELDDDPSNLTNRSPLPMMHIIKSEIMNKAILSHPDIESVPERNKTLLQSMKKDDLEEIYQMIFRRS